MGKSGSTQQRRAPKRSHAPVARPARRSIVLIALAASFVIPMLALLTLAAADVPLGESAKLIYHYSPWRRERVLRALPALLILAPLALLAVRHVARRPRRTAALLGLFLFAASAWHLLAPPLFMSQHLFNFISPAQDGAFVVEATRITDARSYLRDFDERLSRTVMQANGARVISNPPGLTLLAYAIRAPDLDQSDPTQRYLHDVLNMRDADIPTGATGLRLAAILELAWVASAFVAYALARLYLPPAGAVLFAIIVTFNPATMHFGPGKDAAQLLLINLMLWAWLAGWKHNSALLSTAAGALLVIGSAFTLLSLWIALAMLIACLWQEPFVPRVLRNVLPAVLGAAIALILSYVLFGWNMLATVWTLSRHFDRIQRELAFDRSLWFVIGLPIFLLFLSPAIWTLATLRLRKWQSRPFRFGERLLLLTVAIMLITYLIGVQYELPRLWIAFWPPLVLGLMLSCKPLTRVRHDGRAARALATIAAAQVAFTIAHWTLLDVREAEHRLEQNTIFMLK